jgi:hypothetical protein
MKYTIFDIRGGLLADDKIIEAKSPIEAVRKIYNNVKRVKNGDIVVNNRYCYIGVRKNDN